MLKIRLATSKGSAGMLQALQSIIQTEGVKGYVIRESKTIEKDGGGETRRGEEERVIQNNL